MIYQKVQIPDGVHCVNDNLKKCKLASYASHLQAYNCRLFGLLLKGGKFPLKCAQCLATMEKGGGGE